jgi:hypothetical protein
LWPHLSLEAKSTLSGLSNRQSQEMLPEASFLNKLTWLLMLISRRLKKLLLPTILLRVSRVQSESQLP